MKTDPGRCHAYQASDQMLCPTCHTAWDVNDPSPPECARTGWAARASGGSVERRTVERKTNQQRRAEDPGEFKVGTPRPVDKERGKAFIGRALDMLNRRTEQMDMHAANPGEKAKKE